MRGSTKKPQKAVQHESTSDRVAGWLGKSPSKWVAWAGQALPVFGARIIFSFLLGAALGVSGLWVFAWLYGLSFLSSVPVPVTVTEIPPANWEVRAEFVHAPAPGDLPSPLDTEEKKELAGAAVRLYPTSIVKPPVINKFGEMTFTYSVPNGKELEDQITMIELLDHKKWKGSLLIDREGDETNYSGGHVDAHRSTGRIRTYIIELIPRQ